MNLKRITLCLGMALCALSLHAQLKGWEVGGSVDISNLTMSPNAGESQSATTVTIEPYVAKDLSEHFYAGVGLSYRHSGEPGRTSNLFGISPFVGYYKQIVGRLYWMPELWLSPMFGKSNDKKVATMGLDLAVGEFRYYVTERWAVSVCLASLGYNYTKLQGTGSEHEFYFNVNPLSNTSLSVSYSF